MADQQAPLSPLPRVLIVDDEPPNLRTFKRIFNKTFDILTAESLVSALEVMATHPAEVVVTDFAMPGGTGVELARELRKRFPHVQVLMITGFPDLPEVIEAHRERLIAAVVVKPWERENILMTLTQLLRLQEMRRSVAELTGAPLEKP